METIAMTQDIPAWAKQRVLPGAPGIAEVSQLHGEGRAEIQVPDLKALKGWAKSHGWPAPLFGFKEAFLTKLFESDETLSLALDDSGVSIYIPIHEHTLTLEQLQHLDALYEEREDTGDLRGRPTQWGTLVNELREIRHLVEAGVEVKVEGTDTVLTTWQSFYAWAHGRYHMLEDGYDSWIGDG